MGTSKRKTKDAHLSYYIPQPSATDNWDWPFVHIVNTRFMQEQGNLLALGKARLALFQVFCLPTMQRQTTQQFLWIIKTDPHLDPQILEAMVEELRPYPNFYLVASNQNFRVNENFPGAWRDGAEVEDLSRSRVYTGNQTLLERAMAVHHTTDPYAVLETRLDSDDGLHVQFIEAVQNKAVEMFQKREQRDRPRWMYWCSRRHVEWHFSERELKKESIWKQITTYGALSGVQHSKLCITPGITVGFAVGVAEKEVPSHPHHTLLENIQSTPREEACGLEESAECLQFVENFVFEAIRSRSPTSAGMLGVEVPPEGIATDGWLYYAFMNMIRAKFGISSQQLMWINHYLSDHLVEIAEDNLLGQCTTGHSCKVSHGFVLFSTVTCHPHRFSPISRTKRRRVCKI
jgi:hypothetical protein